MSAFSYKVVDIFKSEDGNGKIQKLEIVVQATDGSQFANASYGPLPSEIVAYESNPDLIKDFCERAASLAKVELDRILKESALVTTKAIQSDLNKISIDSSRVT